MNFCGATACFGREMRFGPAPLPPPGNRAAAAAGPFVTHAGSALGAKLTCILPLGVIVTQRGPARSALAGSAASLRAANGALMLFTTQLTGDPEIRPATASPDIPAPTIVGGSARAAAAGHWTAMTAARMTAATVHRFRPNSAMPIAATGTSKMPQPK